MNANLIPAVPGTEAAILDGLDAETPCTTGWPTAGSSSGRARGGIGGRAVGCASPRRALPAFGRGSPGAGRSRRRGDGRRRRPAARRAPCRRSAGPRRNRRGVGSEDPLDAWPLGRVDPSCPCTPLRAASLAGAEVGDLLGDALVDRIRGVRRSARSPRHRHDGPGRRRPARSPAGRKGRLLRQLGGPHTPFGQALTSVERPDRIVLNDLAAEFGVSTPVWPRSPTPLRRSAASGRGTGRAHGPAARLEGEPEPPAPGTAVLASWNLLIGDERFLLE